AGRRWKARWLPHHSDTLMSGEHVVAFLGEHCPTCKLWASPLSKINNQSDMPPILGVMSIDEEAIATYKKENGITFPVVPMKKSTYVSLVDAVPTIAVIRDGVVSSVNEG